MSVSANTVWNIRTGGNDSNGGGFVTGASGTDYSLVDNKRTATGTDDSTTDAVANGTTTITSATANFGTSIIGNIICLSGGTGSLTKTWRQVTARASTTSITVDATVASGTGITMNIGGALASLGMAGGAGIQAGNIVYQKAGSYSITSASNNVSGGCFSTVSAIHVIGYNSTQGDMSSTRPVNTASGAISSFTVIATAGIVACIEVDCASKTSSRGISSSSSAHETFFCKVSNATNVGIFSSGTGPAIACEATGCSSQPAFSAWQFAHSCVAHDNTITGFGGNGTKYVNCIADTNTGASSDGFTSGSILEMINCVAYNNGRHGYNPSAQTHCINCVAESNASTGFNMGSLEGNLLVNCATFGNGTAVSMTGKAAFNIGQITGSSSFFTNAASGDFTPNNTASAGALLRAAGYPTTFPGTSTTFYRDVGAAQHQDPTASGGMSFYGGA